MKAFRYIYVQLRFSVCVSMFLCQPPFNWIPLAYRLVDRESSVLLQPWLSGAVSVATMSVFGGFQNLIDNPAVCPIPVLLVISGTSSRCFRLRILWSWGVDGRMDWYVVKSIDESSWRVRKNRTLGGLYMCPGKRMTATIVNSFFHVSTLMHLSHFVLKVKWMVLKRDVAKFLLRCLITFSGLQDSR